MTDTHKDTFTYGMNSNSRPYDMAMGMRGVKESLELEGENDMSKLEEMKDEGC